MIREVLFASPHKHAPPMGQRDSGARRDMYASPHHLMPVLLDIAYHFLTLTSLSLIAANILNNNYQLNLKS